MCYTPTDIEAVECLGRGAGNLGGEFSGDGNGHLECTMPSLECAATSEQQEYLDDLWFLLHHSDDDNTAVLGLTTYLDDSGSDDGSPLVTCGGPLMSRIQFKEFSKRWAKMYEVNQYSGYTLEPPLHMVDFVTPHGKYSGLYPEFKRHFFRRVATLINQHKLYSIAIAISQTDFAAQLSEDVKRNLIGPYAFAFFAIVGAHQFLSKQQLTGPLRTSYLVDHGFAYESQLRQAHSVLLRFEIAFGDAHHTGAFGTDTDTRVAALQAADVVSWAVRKIELTGALPEGFEPLAEILREDLTPPHRTISIPHDGIKMLADPINKWISEHGSVPQLADIVIAHFNGKPFKLKA